MRNKESLLYNRDIFKNETELKSVLNKMAEMPDVNLGYVRHQKSSSNIAIHEMMFYNLNDAVLEQFDNFCMSFGFYKIGEYVFYSHPYCPCNNPATIYIVKPTIINDNRFVDWFNKKEYNKADIKDMDWCRVYYNDPVFSELNLSRFNRDVFYDGYKYYVPFNICDRLISDSGCSAPFDFGYVAHNKE